MSAADRAYEEARAQGLPERVDDPSAVARVAELLASARAAEAVVVDA